MLSASTLRRLAGESRLSRRCRCAGLLTGAVGEVVTMDNVISHHILMDSCSALYP